MAQPQSEDRDPRPNVRCIGATELCQRLSLSRTSLWRLQRRRRHPIPFVKLSAKVIFPLDAIEKWLSAEVERTRAARA